MPTSAPILNKHVERVLVSQQQIADRVKEMADEITANHPDPSEPLVILCVLNGSVVFLADLIRHLPIRMLLGVIGASSYSGKSTVSKGPSIWHRMHSPVDMKDKHVLIVDDILDSGNTLRLVRQTVEEQNPKSVATTVLLRKPDKAPQDVEAEYIGFDIEDAFVVGYGLDYAGEFRNLPHIAVLKPECYADDVGE